MDNVIEKEDNLKDNTEEDLVKSLYKYSGIDMGPNCCECYECKDCVNKRNKRIKDKLQGEVYFSTPLVFNDIIDSQLKVKNNAKDLTDNELSLKLREIYSDTDIKDISNVKKELKNPTDNETVKLVRKEQLEKLGIACFTTDNVNATMWGYYTNNTGVCIEYDTTNLIYDIITSFASQMSKELTELLIKKKYTIESRDKKSKPKRTVYARTIFHDEKEIVKSLENNSILSNLEPNEQKYFVQNLHTKRLWGKKVTYHSKENLDKIEPNLFENKKSSKISGKYFAKDEFWKHEQEYRFILSLGGRKAIELRQDTIKSITIGANASKETIQKIKENVSKDIPIYKIVVENNRLTVSPYTDN